MHALHRPETHWPRAAQRPLQRAQVAHDARARVPRSRTAPSVAPSSSLTCRHLSATAAPSIGSELTSFKVFLGCTNPTGLCNIGVVGGWRIGPSVDHCQT